MLISEETDKLLYDLHQKISDTRPSEKEMAQHACFIAGTLVHTDKGLVPINKIKVGDRVLSRDENNPDAENVYKRVVSTFKSAEKKRIIHQCYLTQEGYGYLFCTEDHPIWVDHLVDAVEDENGKLIPERTYNEWVPALYLSSDEEHVLRTVDNDYAVVQSFETVSKATSILGKNCIGLWDNRYGEYADEFITVTEDDYTIWEQGYEIDIIDGVRQVVPKPSMLLPNEKVCCYMPGEEPEYYGEPVEIPEDEGKDYCAYVYNIEVEDTHTYFVGAAGIWVHNCGGAAGRECITRQLSLQHIQTLLPAAKQYWLDAGASSEVLDLAQFSVADLEGKVAAVTRGAQVVFDASGAGFGWFVDPTPHEHGEFKQGSTLGMDAPENSPAHGRLDLLTVLIHELGHVLGMSPQVNDDVMSLYLDAGERRLPGVADAAYLRMYTTRAHSNTPAVPVLPPKLWQPETAHSALINSDFAQGLHGWRQVGAVRADNGSVWLHEASDGHTRLAQAFRLNAKQKVLGFTLHDGHISDNGGTHAPDAFEAALLDAATGKPLFTGGLDRSDSLLNMQADGSETIAPSIRRIYNADGSRSYHLDLSAYLAAQTAAGREADVWLSFDLLGFGNADSKIRISNIGLSEDMPVQHQKVNDPASPKPSENTGGSTATPKPSDNAHGGHGTPPMPSENTGGSTVTPKPSDNAHGGNGTTLRPSENTGGSTAMPKPSDNAHGGHGTTLMPSENTNSRTGQPSLPDTPQPEARDEGRTETPATAFNVSDGLRIARDILLLLNPDDAAGTGGTWLWEQPVSVGEGKNYTLGFDYQARIDEPVLLKIYQGSRLIRQSRIDGGTSGRFDLPLAGSGHTDFIRIYAERAAVSAAHAIMPSEKPAARLSVSQRLGWFLLAAALLLAMIAQYQGYPLLPARRRRQVILSGLPAGSTLGDGRHSLTATEERQEADIGDWDAGNLQLDLGGTPAADTRLLLTVTTPRFSISREIRRYAFVLDEQGGCEIWHNGSLLAASGKRTAETSDGQIRLDLSAIVKNRPQSDETWMRRAEKRLTRSWHFFKK